MNTNILYYVYETSHHERILNNHPYRCAILERKLIIFKNIFINKSWIQYQKDIFVYYLI